MSSTGNRTQVARMIELLFEISLKNRFNFAMLDFSLYFGNKFGKN